MLFTLGTWADVKGVACPGLKQHPMYVQGPCARQCLSSSGATGLQPQCPGDRHSSTCHTGCQAGCTSRTRCLSCIGLGPTARGLLWWLQVWRWSQQYESQLVGSPLPEMQQLSAWLKDHVPADDEDSAVGRISHGDFRWVHVLLDKKGGVGRMTCCNEATACGA